MRYLFLFLFIAGLFAFNVAFAQNDTTVYHLNKSGKIMLKDSADFIAPRFPGEAPGIGELLGANLVYPKQALRNGTQGRVIVTFIIEKDGHLTDVKVARGIGDGCDEEAVRVIKLSPIWKPGYLSGMPVRVAFSVPVSFTMGR